MRDQLTSEVIVYHDETGHTNFNGHCFLFVPERTTASYTNDLFGDQIVERFPLRDLYSKMLSIRERHNASHKFHFTDIGSGIWRNENSAELDFILAGIEALKSARPQWFKYPLFCKAAIILYPNPTPVSLGFYTADERRERLLRFHETVMRMLLKGAIHYLYDHSHRVIVKGVISDGEPNHRRLSENRILWRMVWDDLSGKSLLKDYVAIAEDAYIAQVPSHHREHQQNSIGHLHAHMLQLTDMLLGSAVYSCLKDSVAIPRIPTVGSRVNSKKGILSSQVKEMLDKRKRGKGFQSSGHYKSFNISHASIEDGAWQFSSLMTRDIVIDSETGSLSLFDVQV
jgi:hypothetical protein